MDNLRFLLFTFSDFYFDQCLPSFFEFSPLSKILLLFCWCSTIITALAIDGYIVFGVKGEEGKIGDWPKPWPVKQVWSQKEVEKVERKMLTKAVNIPLKAKEKFY